MRLGRLSAVGAAAAGLAMIAAPALADAPYTVSYDGSTTGDHSVTATAKGDTTLSANGIDLICTSSTVGATVHAGTYATSPAAVATIGSAAWSGCSMSGFPATVSVTSPSWALNIVDPNSQTTALTDTLGGSITGINNVAVDVNLGLAHCTFTVSGNVTSGQFLEDNGKGGQEIDVNASPGLTIASPSSGCLGLVNDGDAATFDGQYNLSGQHINVY